MKTIQPYLLLLLTCTLLSCSDDNSRTKTPNADAGPLAGGVSLFEKASFPEPKELNSIFGTWELVIEGDRYPDRLYEENQEVDESLVKVGTSTERIRFTETEMIFSRKCSVFEEIQTPSASEPLQVPEPQGLMEALQAQADRDAEPGDPKKYREYSLIVQVTMPIEVDVKNRKLKIMRNSLARDIHERKEEPRFACVLDFSNYPEQEITYLAQDGELFLPGPTDQEIAHPDFQSEIPEVVLERSVLLQESLPDPFDKISDQ